MIDDLMRVDPERRADVLLDRLTVESRSYARTRPRAFSAREGLLALQFEGLFLHAYGSLLRKGEAPTDDDQARLVTSLARLNAIADEAAS